MAEEVNEPTLDEALTGDEATESTEAESTAEQTTDETASSESEEPSPKELAAARAQANDERRKRQRIEREFRAELADLRSQLKGGPERPSVLDDEDGAIAHIESGFNQKLLQTTIAQSQEMMRLVADDYDEMEDVFYEMAQEDKVLQQEMMQHPMPAKFVYETAKKKLERDELTGDGLEEWKQKERAAIKAEVLKELRGELSENAETKANADAIAEQPSLADERTTSTQETVTDESLEEILGR